MKNLTHTIAAISTPPGKGGVAIIRLSGDMAFEIADRVFFPISGKKFSRCPGRMQIYGYLMDGDEVVDDCLATRFPSPHSYTGEDTVEIGCHGGRLVSAMVLETLLKAGAIPAGPGEFTRRAFVNGRLSLTEAEAISDLLEATTREQVKLSAGKARSALAERIASIRESTVSLMSSMYARIDYPDEDLGDFTDDEILNILSNIRKDISSLLRTYDTGRSIAEGIRCAICGKPNVGKSSLYNLLVGEEAAIVTDIEGTTRDVLERSISLGKVKLLLADTAGIRDEQKADTVERIGIDKSYKMAEKCELMFAIFDISRPFDDDDRLVVHMMSKSDAMKIIILNKADRAVDFDMEAVAGLGEVCITSSLTDSAEECLDQIREIVNQRFTDGSIKIGEDAVITSARQFAALHRAEEFIDYAYSALEMGISQDAISSDVERAIGALSELDGKSVSEEIVSDIFSKFCVGK